ncbi:XdhC family protein [Arenicella xantha]|uniref:Xanthine dehydrogenase accessory factor n=1 Tax=Arenicella xantha TaxID=644221 RepID=A0A395JK06_9GAMM|nr:XdhC family protein [Arenicella xantha]RBP49381.1 xanthine dehydrogenase accessory factor [Arenicella xantha]
MNVNYTDQPPELIAAALDWVRSGSRVVLATLVNIEGNAPYPLGTQMLVNEQGDYLGQMTGGCAERAIADQALLALQQERNQAQRYGLGSPFFDIKLPCGSGIDVYFDCQQTEPSLLHLLTQLEARQVVPMQVGQYQKTYVPTPRLMLFGQGPIMQSLTKLAMATGYDVVCCVQNDDTKAQLEAHGFCTEPLARAIDIASAADSFSAVVSLFHEHDLEIPILQRAVESPAFYIGALGSKRTHASRLVSLETQGVKPGLLSKIHGPVGMDIDATTPSQIAVSILAEMVAVMNRIHG